MILINHGWLIPEKAGTSFYKLFSANYHPLLSRGDASYPISTVVGIQNTGIEAHRLGLLDSVSSTE